MNIRASLREDRTVLSLSWPIFLQLALTYLLGIIDVYVLSRISDEAAAAVGAVNTVMTFVIMMFSFMGQAGSLLYGQCIGAAQHRRAQRYATVALVLHLFAGLLAGVLLSASAAQIARALGLTGTPLGYGAAYLRIMGGAIVLQSLVSLLSGVLAANGRTKHAMTVSVLTGAINVVLLYVVVLSPAGPHWGVRGVAVSTATAIAVGLVYSSWLTVVRLRLRFAVPRSLRRFLLEAGDLIRYTVPITVEPLLWQAAQIVTTVIIATIGPDELAARIYTLTITNMIGMCSLALSQGVQIAISHQAGSRQVDAARRSYTFTVRLGLLLAVALSVLSGVCGRWIMHLYTDDEHVVAIGSMLLVLGLLYLPGSSAIMITASSLRAVGHVRYPAVIGVAVLWAVFVPLAYTLSLPVGLGIVGVMLAMGVDENLRALLLRLRWRYLTAPPRRDSLFAHAIVHAVPRDDAPARP